MILRNLWRRKTRTALTILGIAIGVAAVIVLSAFGAGMSRGFGQIGSSAEADLVVSQSDAILLMMSAIDEEIGDEIAQIKGVDEVAPAVVGIVQLPETPYFLVSGEEPHAFSTAHYRIIEGAPLSGRRQVMLGRAAARNLNKSVGQTFRIGSSSYRVVGIYETGATFEDNGAVIELTDAQRAFDKRRQVSFFKLKVRDLRQIDEVRAAIEARWDDLTVTRSGEPSKQDDLLAIYDSLGWFLGIFAILVGGLGMMNTMLMSVFERTREIGVLRALGWRRRRVIALILGESLTLALAGGLVGIGLGTTLIWLAGCVPAVSGFLEGVFNPKLVIQALVTALVLGILGGIYPAWRAAQLAPIEAMGSEGGTSLRWGRTTQWVAIRVGSGALRNILRRPARTLMTVVGLGIGVGFSVALLGIVEGSRTLFTQLLSAGQADLVAEQANVSDAAFSAIDERIADQMRAHPEVRSVSKLVFGTANVSELPFFLVFGLDPREEYIQHYRVREGRTLERQRELILGRIAAKSLEKGIGDSLIIGGTSYRIVGVFENGVAFEDSGSVMALKDAQRLFNRPRQVSFIGIRLHHPERAAEVAAQLEGSFPDVIVSQAAQLTERMQDFATMNTVFNALMALMVVIGGIVMLNVMMMSVFERTQEIGVLRALGWHQARVLRMVLVEAGVLSVCSGLAGGLIGIGLSALFALEPTYGSLLPVTFTPMSIAAVLALVVLLGLVGGVLPAWRASNLRPADALRYE